MKKRLLSAGLIFSLILSFCLAGCSAASSQEESGTESVQLTLSDYEGTYSPLFDTINLAQYDSVWEQYCAELVDESEVAGTVTALKDACGSTVYGEEAIDAGTMQFDCEFINGVATIEFSGNTITVYDGSGDIVSSHEYRSIGTLLCGESEEMSFDTFAFESVDSQNDEFRYFLMRDDTMGSTYHIEFRYGGDLDELHQLLVGEYAYWLAAGISVDASEQTINDCIELYVRENLGG